MAPRYKPSASSNDPRITNAGAAKNKMMEAIALSKAKQSGAQVPEKG